MRKYDDMNVLLNLRGNGVPTMATLKKLADYFSAMHYKGIYFGFSGVFELKDEPRFGWLRGRYSKADIIEFDKYCETKGIRLMPAIQSFGQLYSLGKYADYRGIFETWDTTLVDEEKTYAFFDKWIRVLRDCFRADRLHIGLDDCLPNGFVAHLNKFGYEEKYAILARHAKRICEIAKKYGFSVEMWSDIYQRGASLDTLDDVILSVRDFDFEDKGLPHILTRSEEKVALEIEKTARLSKNTSFTTEARCWFGFAPDNMNAIKAVKTSMDLCRKYDIKGYNVEITLDRGSECSWFAALPTLYFASEYALGNTDCIENVNKEKFFAITGVTFDNFLLLDLPNKPYLNKEYPESNSKCMFYLYNDPFLGTMNPLVSDEIGEAYKKLVSIFDSVNEGKFSYLFEMASMLCRVLSNKAELGKKIENAYKSGDKRTLETIAEKTIPQIIEDIETLFSVFENAWVQEKKSFGIEVHAHRFGGLIERLRQIQKKLIGYVEGVINELSEVGIQRYVPAYFVENPMEDDLLLYDWNLIATDNKLE